MSNNPYRCAEGTFHSFLKEVMADFVGYKVSCGYSDISFLPKLALFDKYCMKHPALEPCLTRECVMGFLQLQPGEKKSNLRSKCKVIRSLGKYMASVKRMENVYIVPFQKGNGKGAYIPYVFSIQEISSILCYAQTRSASAMAKLPNILNAHSCIFPMLYCTGMRISEVLDLRVGDVDLETRIIHINHAKNGNKRWVTISDTLAEACTTYIRKASKVPSNGVYFFDSGASYRSGRINRVNSYHHFRKILGMAGIKHRGRGFGPRLHDFRTTFAVHSLKQLTHRPGDINVHLASLSAFMGHKSIYSTQDYIWLTGELFSETMMKMENYTAFITDIFDEKVVVRDNEGIL